MMKLVCSIVALLGIVFVAIFSCTVEADSNTAVANLTVTVTVLENNCRVNDNQVVMAEFGSVLVDKLSQAAADVPVTIACDADPAGTLLLEIKGTSSSFNNQALQTDTSGLGITLDSPNSDTLDLNTFYDVSQKFGLSSKTGTFNLKAHLVSDSKTKLDGGEFNASATLVMQVS